MTAPPVPWASELRPTPYEIAAFATIGALNIALDKTQSHARSVAISLTGAALLMALARAAGATPAGQGLDPSAAKRGVIAGLVIGLPAATALAAVALAPPLRQFYRNQPALAREIRHPAYELLIRIPLITAGGEELAFRGGLEPLLRVNRSPTQAAALTAAAFGAWHILPTIDRFRELRRTRDLSSAQLAGMIAAAVGTTAAASLLFGWLRDRTGSLLAPVLLHYAVNAGGFAGGWLLSRQNEQSVD
jgi:membrane protease YdiL (CAAX protease family)